MALPATDDFTGGAAALSGNWTQQQTSPTVNRDGSGNAVLSGSGEGYVFWNADVFNDDQYSKAIIDAFNGDFVEITTRASGQNATFDNYPFYTNGASGSGNTEFGYWLNNVFTVLGSVAVTFAAADEIELRSSGNSHQPRKNGANVGSPFSDSTLASGSAGLGMTSGGGSGGQFRSWEGGNLGGGGGGGGAQPPRSFIETRAAHRALEEAADAQFYGARVFRPEAGFTPSGNRIPQQIRQGYFVDPEATWDYAHTAAVFSPGPGFFTATPHQTFSFTSTAHRIEEEARDAQFYGMRLFRPAATSPGAGQITPRRTYTFNIAAHEAESDLTNFLRYYGARVARPQVGTTPGTARRTFAFSITAQLIEQELADFPFYYRLRVMRALRARRVGDGRNLRIIVRDRATSIVVGDRRTTIIPDDR